MTNVTRILQQVEQGDRPAAELLPLVYDELRKLAADHPQYVEAWTSDRDAITRDRVTALRADLAEPSAVALCGERSAGGTALQITGKNVGQEKLQLHWRPQDLRDLSASVPVLSRV